MHRSSLKLAIVLSILLLAFWPLAKVDAQQLTNRTILISTANPSATATHVFQFTFTSTSSIGSIAFEYCENSPVFTYSCTAPGGLDVSSANLASQTGNLGFSIDNVNSTTNKIVLTRPSVASLAVASSYTFSNVINPSAAAQSEFVRISTYASTDGSGSFTDNGSVVYATASPFNVGADVPPFLKLCVALTVAPDCSTMSGDIVDLGSLSSKVANAGVSQFAVGTNSLSGYTTFVIGTTITSGNNAISALTSPTPSFPGNSQFGINLRDNSNPNIGSDPFGPGSASPTTNYNTANLFTYNSGDSIASSPQPSDYNLMTVSYLVNVGSGQAPGVYASTFTYLATASF